MRKIIPKVAFMVYALILLRITVFRSGWMWNEPFTGSVELVPFQTIFSYLKTGEYWEFSYLFLGNILWFVPLGFYEAFRGRKIWQCALAGCSFSFAIEFLQYALSTGYSEVEDILLNTLGAILGCFLWLGFGKLFRKQRKNETD